MNFGRCPEVAGCLATPKYLVEQVESYHPHPLLNFAGVARCRVVGLYEVIFQIPTQVLILLRGDIEVEVAGRFDLVLSHDLEAHRCLVAAILRVALADHQG